MQAICVDKIGSFRFMQVPRPTPARDELLIRVTVTGVCRTDLKVIEKGHRDLVLPRIPGEEIVGQVVASGDPDRQDLIGRRVYVYPGTWCGTCDCCRRQAFNMCRQMRIAGFHRDGGFAEYVAVPCQTVIPLPADLADETAVFAEPLSCCLNALEQARLQATDRVCIFGGGPAGTLLARLADALGATEVTVLDPDPARQERHRQRPPFSGEYDVVIPAVGSADAYTQGLACLAPRGRLVVFAGLAPSAIPPVDLNQLHYLEQTLVGSYGCQYAHGTAAIGLLQSGQVRTDDLVTHRFGLERLAEALDIVRDRGGMKALLYPGGAGQ